MEIIIILFELLQYIIPVIVIGLAWYMLIAKKSLNQEKQIAKIESKIKPGVLIVLKNGQKAVVISCMKFSIIIEDDEGQHREVYKQYVKNIFYE